MHHASSNERYTFVQVYTLVVFCKSDVYIEFFVKHTNASLLALDFYLSMIFTHFLCMRYAMNA
jgi:hypothetical protein